MKLYSVPHSPYSSRVRIQILAGNLPVEICEPAGGLGSDAFKSLTPTGKVPTLDTGKGYLVESAAIMEYLEERYPDKALMPASPEQRAWLRALARFTDLELAQALFPLFLELKLKTGDSEAIAGNLQALKQKLSVLERFFADSYKADLNAFGFLDCVLAPTLFYVVKVPAIFGESDILAATPALSDWWASASERNPVSTVLEEMAAGLASMLGK